MMKQKRGQTLNLVNGTVISFMILIFTVFAVLFGIATLNPSSFFTASSLEANATSNLQANLTTGVSVFGSYIPTVMKVLAIVVILAALFLLIVYIARSKQVSGTAAGGGL